MEAARTLALARLPARTARWLVALALLLALLAGVMQWERWAPMRQIDAFFYDTFLQWGASQTAESSVVLVSIDDNTLSEVGQWPWPRYKLAQLLERVASGKPAVVGLDITFPEPDRAALSTLIQAYREEFGLDLGLDGVPPQLLENDAYLGVTMSELGVIGAVHLLFDQTNREAVRVSPPQGIRLSGEVEQLHLQEASGILQNTFRIQSQLRQNGFINMQPDDDGKLRRLPLLLRYQGTVYPHVLLAGLLRADGTDTVTVQHDMLGVLLRVGDHVIPVDADGTLLLRYPSVRPPVMVSALEVLREGLPAVLAAGKPVFVGASASVLHDFVNSPLNPQFPGLGIYAVGLDNILSRQYLREPKWRGPAALALSLLCGGLIAVLFLRLERVRVLLVASFGLLLAFMSGNAWLAVEGGVYLSPAPGVVTIVLSFMWLSIARYAIEKRRAFAWLEQISNTQRVAIESMAAVAETRDP